LLSSFSVCHPQCYLPADDVLLPSRSAVWGHRPDFSCCRPLLFSALSVTCRLDVSCCVPAVFSLSLTALVALALGGLFFQMSVTGSGAQNRLVYGSVCVLFVVCCPNTVQVSFTEIFVRSFFSFVRSFVHCIHSFTHSFIN
jgi:hypothetical protein